jgi:pSer/pThr/pTyr-binding forkhead associated (FHA) protein
MSQQKKENVIAIALRDVFGRLIETTSKLPAPLAYGSAVTISVLVFVLLGGVIQNDLLWLLGIVILACLIAFVITDWKARQDDKLQSTESQKENSRPAKNQLPKNADDNLQKHRSKILLIKLQPESGRKNRYESIVGRITLGRNPISDIKFPVRETGVSWDHGIVYLAKDKLYYRHLSRSQNTVIENTNGDTHVLQPNRDREYLLKNQDCILIGKYKFLVTFDIIGTNKEFYIPTNDIE